MAIEVLREHEIGDMVAVYLLDADTGQIGLHMVPAGKKSERPRKRMSLEGVPEVDALPAQMGSPAAWAIDPLVHLSISDDKGPGGFSRGRTLRGSPSQLSFQFGEQSIEESSDRRTIITTLNSAYGLTVEHHLEWRTGAPYVSIHHVLRHEGTQPLSLELLSSFALSHISPFACDDAPDRLVVHRFRADWSAEGRHIAQTVEELGLERSWSGHGVRSERFGQVGTMPVRGWFPTVFVEDKSAGVMWGAALGWAGSWQMELYRKDDCLNVSGGLADREFGHWTKTLQPGDVFSPPPAVMTCGCGSLDEMSERITASHREHLDTLPGVEADLPIVANEWCTSWGEPTHENLTSLADALAAKPITYLVIDAGWYKPDAGSWSSAQGDWTPSVAAFPDGLQATAQAIRDRGLIPGLWFEYECIGRSSASWSDNEDLQLHFDGRPIDSGGRRFWDMRKSGAQKLLEERVIDLLEQCGFGYLKIDYNETAGFGADGAESPGEGIRQQVEGSYEFLDRIRARLPELVIENCSSGGHRLEASMVGRTSMSSFSDAHECPEIPIIAANLNRLVLPRQSQVWAVLRSKDSPKRLVYSLAACFLGRLCLSGELAFLSADQWQIVDKALALYRRITPVIAQGSTRRYGIEGGSYRYAKGWQAVARTSSTGRQTVVVVHRFGGPDHDEISIPLSAGADWTIASTLSEDGVGFTLSDGKLTVSSIEEFSAVVVLLQS